MINTVIFDLDGTLLDTLNDLAASVNHALKAHGLTQRSTQEIRRFLGNGIRNLMLQSTGGELDGEAFDKVFQTFRAHYVDHCLDTTRPYPGIMPLLEALKSRGVGMGIVSNKLQPAVTELNERFFKGRISQAIGESATVRRKPNPDAVLAALRNLGSDKAAAIYVGDSEVDLATAQNAGLRCALVTWGFRDEDFLRALPQASTATFIHKPEELLNLVDTSR